MSQTLGPCRTAEYDRWLQNVERLVPPQDRDTLKRMDLMHLFRMDLSPKGIALRVKMMLERGM